MGTCVDKVELNEEMIQKYGRFYEKEERQHEGFQPTRALILRWHDDLVSHLER